MVAIGRHKHLRLVAQAAEADRMDEPVAVALKSVARAADGVEFAPLLFFVKAAAGALRVRCPGREVRHYDVGPVTYPPIS